VAPTDDDLASSRPVRSVRDLPLHRRLVFFGFSALVMLGIVFYVWWGLSYNVWLDNGVYAVVATLVLFGLAGMWLMMPTPVLPALPPEHSH
jgi:hypothetical protein